MNPKNLRTLTPILEVRTPFAKAILGKTGLWIIALEHMRLSCLSCSSALRLFAWRGNSYRSLSYLHLQQEFHLAQDSHPSGMSPITYQTNWPDLKWTKVLTNHLSQFSPEKLSCTSTRLANVVCIYTIGSALDASFMPFLASFCPILTCSASLVPGVDPD